jgi:hypothetical protein
MTVVAEVLTLGQSPRAPPSQPPWSPFGDASTFARKASKALIALGSWQPQDRLTEHVSNTSKS